MEVFSGVSADHVWRQAHRAVIAVAGRKKVQASREGETVELLHAAIEIADPRQRWITSRSPAVNPAFAIAEVLSILAGSNDAAVLNYWFRGLPRFRGAGPTYPGAYGYRLRQQFGVDQVRRACEALAANPDSRQVVLQIWDAQSDLPHGDGTPRCKDVPCNVTSLLKSRDGRLEWTQIMRSNDLNRGLPNNIVQFTMLQEVMAGWLRLEVGSYHHWSDSLHAYTEDLREYSCAPEPLPASPNGDALTTGPERGEALAREMYRRMGELTKQEVGEEELAALASVPDAPPGYQNLLRVLAAESARRRRRQDQAEAIMGGCTNPQLTHAWKAWAERMKATAPRGEGVTKPRSS
jgi:thymidylate synthase